MQTWIALLKGVNVGGNNRLPMRELVTELESAGLSDVKTYIQSGNVVFRTHAQGGTKLANTIASAIDARFGFEPHVSVLTRQELGAAVAANPFPLPRDEEEAKRLHFFFLANVPASIDRAHIDSIQRESEQWQVRGAVFYLLSPEGLGESKLAVKVEKVLGTKATARNWRTVNALHEIAAAYELL